MHEGEHRHNDTEDHGREAPSTEKQLEINSEVDPQALTDWIDQIAPVAIRAAEHESDRNDLSPEDRANLAKKSAQEMLETLALEPEIQNTTSKEVSTRISELYPAVKLLLLGNELMPSSAGSVTHLNPVLMNELVNKINKDSRQPLDLRGLQSLDKETAVVLIKTWGNRPLLLDPPLDYFYSQYKKEVR